MSCPLALEQLKFIVPLWPKLSTINKNIRYSKFKARDSYLSPSVLDFKVS